MRCELPNAKVDPTTGGDRLHTGSTLDAKKLGACLFVCLFVCFVGYCITLLSKGFRSSEICVCLFVLAGRFASLCKRGFACSIGRAKSAHLILGRERERARAIQKWSRLARVCVCVNSLPTPKFQREPARRLQSRVQTPEQVPSPDMPCNVWASATYAHV